MLGSLFFKLSNNIAFNQLLVKLGLDAAFISRFGIYKRMRLDESLSPQEMAGFSTRSEVQEAIDKTHHDLNTVVENHLKHGDHILDIGCGAGAYLGDFSNNFKCTGLDLNPQMINAGRKLFPKINFIEDDFLKASFKQKFNLIYSISVLEFIPPSKLDQFFNKVYDSMHQDAIFFLHYPHALKKMDLYYPDLYYIEYSPDVIDSALSKYFNVISHNHAWDNRLIADYDRHPYNPGNRTFKNGYLFVGQRKNNSIS